MKNIVMCFDRTAGASQPSDTTTAGALFGLLDDADRQIKWYHPGAAPSRRTRRDVIDEARAAVAEAYRFLAATWRPGDALFLFGADRGAYCARALARLLGTVGLLERGHELFDYVLDTYGVPATARSAADWRRVGGLATELTGRTEAAVPVSYLGLWDTARIPGLPRLSAGEPLHNVAAGRHAVGIDGIRPGEPAVASRVEEAWFRGARVDVTGGPRACRSLAALALDWVLDGARAAGVMVSADAPVSAPLPSELDALSASPPAAPWRRPPIDAHIHASVEVYLRAHPQYWRRLPARLAWADTDWLARGERLVGVARPVAVEAEPLELAVAS